MLRIVRRARLQVALGIFVTIALLTVSLLHQHTLVPYDPAPSQCVVCAFGSGITVEAPQAVAPAAIEFLLVPESTAPTLRDEVVTIPPRAPPQPG